MKRININIFPKEGFFFMESDGARIRGTSWTGVVSRVRDYRARNKMPVGDPETEVHDQACKRNPNLCAVADRAVMAARQQVSIKGRMLSWLNTMRAKKKDKPLDLVDVSEAKQRADICAACPMNTPFKEGCGACKSALNEVRKNVVGNRALDARITGCSVTGEDLPSSVHIDQARLELPSSPANCWRKRTL